MSGTNDPPGYRPPAKPPTEAVHRNDPPRPTRPVGTPRPVPQAAGGEAEKKKKEITVFAAAPPEPMSANKKLAVAGAVVVAFYVLYWVSTSFTGSAFRDRLTTIPVESYGQDAKLVAFNIVEEAQRRGLPVRMEDVKVVIGDDSALGRIVKMDVRYRRFLLPAKKLHQEVRCPNPLQPGTWDGTKLIPGK